MAFGTRRINPKEHQDGLILAIAVESIVKLVAFLAVGAFVVWRLNNGIGDLTEIARSDPRIASVIQTPPDPAVWVVTTLLSAFAIVLLPRQFHVAVVENHDERGHPHRGLAVSGLSRADQSVRRAARHRWPQDFPGRVFQSRPDRSCAAAQRRRAWRGAPDDGGRPLRGDRNGGGRERRARHHHFQRPGDAAPAPAPRRAGARRRRRHRRAGALGAPDRHRRRSGAGLRLRAHDRQNGPRLDRPPVVRGGGADRAGLSWRPLLASRDCAGRDRRHDRRRAGLALPPAFALDPAGPGALGPFWRTGPWRSRG